MSNDDPLQARFDSAGIRSRTLQGAGATALAQAAKFVLQFATQIVLARMLDPAQFGLVAMVAPILGLVLTLNDFGFGQAVVQRPDITHRQVTALFWLNTAIGAAFTVAAMLAAPLVALAYGEPRVLGITVASASLIMLSSLAAVPLALLNRGMRFVSLASIELTSMVVGLASGLVSARLGAGYWSLVIMQAVNVAVSAVLAWWLCGWRPGRPAREPGVGALLRFGSQLLGSNLAGYLGSSLDNVIVGVVNGKVALGLYDRSYNLVVKPLTQLMAPASRIAVPLLSRLQDSPERYARAYLLMLQLATAASVPGLVATVVAAEPLIAMLFGPKWMAMVPVFSWICIGGVASALSSSTYWLLTTQGRTAELMRCSSIAAGIGVAAFAIGSLWGVVGVARAAALSFLFLQTPLMAWAATRSGPVTAAMLRSSLLPLAVAGAAAAAVTTGVLPLLGGPRWLIVLAAFAMSYGVFALTLMAQPAGRRLVAGVRGVLAWRQAAA